MPSSFARSISLSVFNPNAATCKAVTGDWLSSMFRQVGVHSQS